ncbi:peroxide stress protein YaaA [Capnocytophaga canis]|uniref:UPF0246 protein CCAND38_550012 n=1 Tax=Capnocytophaga canis TaxID=1848903 RepID=A0A0B7IBR0_9FLAO|nr:peroxide stress protein YaaA [Capnocytophaga canis]CEN44524.1 conserved hypothetical protein [Capnocytophaga canis]CEN48144.1 conserved hypothetical protein [Capnocytophaga canis]
MKIVISPAKSLNFERNIPTKEHTQPVFPEKIATVNATLKELSPKQLADLMHISDKLANLNWERNQAFSLPFSLENARQAVYVFDGDVYDGLDVYSLDSKEVERLQFSLRILSGQYGILKPLDLIQPYRLEMGTKISIGRAKNLYDYWKESVTVFLNEELDSNELFVNLASNEYFKVIDYKQIKNQLITPIFKDWKNDELKMISFFAKKARGLMVRYLIKNNIQTLDELKGFDYEGYRFSQQHTTNINEPVFIR